MKEHTQHKKHGRRINSGIYEIVNTVNGHRYVGSALHFGKRWNGHLVHLRRGSHHSRGLQSACKKYGLGALTFRPLIICARNDLLMYEQIAIDALQPGYNMLKVAGSCLGREMSSETRAKIGAKNLGVKHSAEAIERRAAKRRGVKLAPEHRATLLGNKRALGHKHTEEWKQNASARQMGMKRPKSPNHRAKIAASLKGITHSPERRARQAAAQTGKKHRPRTAEQIKKMSAASIAAWTRKKAAMRGRTLFD